MSSYDGLLGAMKELAAGLQTLNRQAVEQLAPLVEGILRSRSRDVRHIEQTLDRLLDHCGYEPAVLLYRRLCRHYWEIAPVATVGYVNAYREIWDTPDEPSDEQPASVEVEQQVANARSCERQGASRRLEQEPSAASPAASAVPLSPCERTGASHRCGDGIVQPASPAASAVPLTEARP